MDTVVIQKNDLRLNSGLNEYSFGKTNYFAMLSEQGLVFDGKQFEQWNFDGVDTFRNNVRTENTNDSPESEDFVFYCGKNPLSEKAESLLEFFNDGGEQLFNAVSLVIKAMTYAAKNNIKLPIVGAGGIIADIDTGRVLFLPQGIFNYSTNLLSEEQYFMENTGWTNETIKDVPAICYERALIVYKLLTKQFPYPSTDRTERNADILDKNFMPLELCIEGINKNFAKEINRALELNSTTVTIPGKHKKGVDSEDLKVNTDFNFEQLKEAWKLSKNSTISEKELTEKVSSYLKAKKSKVDAKRNLRRNTTAIIIAAFVLVFILIMTISSVRRQNNQYTSRGLTSTEVVQGFFQGINSKSLKELNPLAKGSAPEKYIEDVTNIYVLEKQIVGFTREGMYYNPASWFINITDEDRYKSVRVFGVSNLKIDGVPSESHVNLYKRSDNPEDITMENNKELMEDDITTHNAEYYLLRTDLSDLSVFVERVNEEYVLTYKHGRWLITDINTEKETIPVNTEEFKNDYFNALADNGNDVLEAASCLRDKYEWIPTEESLEQEFLKMI